MAYRAPELFDVKTGVTLDEKVDVWVRRAIFQAFSFDAHTPLSVAWVYTIRTRLSPLSVRESPNNTAGRFDSHGCHERSVQAPPERVFPRLQKFDRCDVESEPRGPTQYSSTHRDDGTCPAVVVVISVQRMLDGFRPGDPLGLFLSCSLD